MMNESVSRVLHAVEDVTYVTEAPGAAVLHLTKITGLSETTVRKALRELEDGGFIRRNGADGRSWVFQAIKKQEEEMPKKDQTPQPTGDGRGQREQARERDSRVLALLPATVDEVAAKLGVKRSIAYVSIWRLRNAGQVTKRATGSRTPVWEAK